MVKLNQEYVIFLYPQNVTVRHIVNIQNILWTSVLHCNEKHQLEQHSWLTMIHTQQRETFQIQGYQFSQQLILLRIIGNFKKISTRNVHYVYTDQITLNLLNNFGKYYEQW